MKNLLLVTILLFTLPIQAESLIPEFPIPTIMDMPDIMNDGTTHGTTQTYQFQRMMNVGEDIKQGSYLPQQVKGNTRWTGFKVCLIPFKGIADTDKSHTNLLPSKRVLVQAWVVNQDTGAGTKYYFNHVIDSKTGYCSQREILATKIHFHHKVAVFIRVWYIGDELDTYNNEPQWIKVALGAYSE